MLARDNLLGTVGPYLGWSWGSIDYSKDSGSYKMDTGALYWSYILILIWDPRPLGLHGSKSSGVPQSFKGLPCRVLPALERFWFLSILHEVPLEFILAAWQSL